MPTRRSLPTRSRWSGRRRFAPLAVLAGVGATAALALSTTGTLSAFTAQITNSANTVTDGTLVMTESQTVGQATTTCNSTDTNSVAVNSATCTTINKFGGVANLVPGGTSSATIVISNTGTATASAFTLTPGACAQSGNVAGSATDLCSKMTIKLDKVVGGTTTNVIPAGTTLAAANTNGAYNINSMSPNAAVTFNFTVTLPAGLTNAYQGLTVTQPLVWLFTAGS
ncbi:hypothetical protein ACXR2U_03195 [Jatrophihabitans sp. YIM 134969]